MSDPFRSELEAAHRRIEQLESEHAARVAELQRENKRLRERLADVAPSRTKTGRTFFAIAIVTLAVSLAGGMIFARVVRPRPGAPPTPSAAPTFELPASPVAPEPEFDQQAVERALGEVDLSNCGSKTSGHVDLVLSPAGFVSRAQVDAPLQGTSVGDCVEAAFRGVHVPEFGGRPRHVGKSFILPASAKAR